MRSSADDTRKLRRDAASMNRLLLAVALLTVLLLGAAAPTARAGSFLDDDAAVFTLQRAWTGEFPSGVARLRAMPDGGFVFVSPTHRMRVWRFSLDGRREELPWSGRNENVTVGPDGAIYVMRIRSTLVERLDLRRRRRVPVADLAHARGFPHLREGLSTVTLARDAAGATMVGSGSWLWRVAPNGRITRRRLPGVISQLAFSPAGGFVASLAGGVYALDPDGAARPLAQAAAGGRPFAVLADGRILVLNDEQQLVPSIVDPVSGTSSALRWSDAETLGDGDGVGLSRERWSSPVSMTVGADGSLLMAAEGGRIWAIVPRDSRRARTAIGQQTYSSLLNGQVHYLAGPGPLTLEVRAGDRLITRTRSVAPGGSGTLVVPTLPPDAYDLLLSTAGGRLEARARVDLRLEWPLEDAEAALGGWTDTDGDEAGYWGRLPARVGAWKRAPPSA
jgi:hypothetical protein